MKTDGTYHEVYFPDAGQRIYEENRKNCGAKLKLDTAIDFIQQYSVLVSQGTVQKHNVLL